MTYRKFKDLIGKIIDNSDIDYLSLYEVDVNGRYVTVLLPTEAKSIVATIHLSSDYEITFDALSKLSEALKTKNINITGEYCNDTYGGSHDNKIVIKLDYLLKGVEL